MWRILRHLLHVFQRFSLILGLITIISLLFQSTSTAQQPTATISTLKGTVTISLQGKAPVNATEGIVLQQGDIIETQAGAEVVLILSEGSELRLGQNTKIDIAALSQRSQTKARTSKIKLLYGRIRAFLSPGHQKEGSSFTVETPNALAGVKFSRPVIDVSYDPSTETSLFKAYTVALEITNRMTREFRQVPRESQAIVREEMIIIDRLKSNNKLMQKSRMSVRRATSPSAPVSIPVVTAEETGATTTETSSNPSPGSEPPGKKVNPRPITVTIREE